MRICIVMALAAISLEACATPKEKTAPCKRPANLTAYVAGSDVPCGPMHLINPDERAVLAAIHDLARRPK